MQKITDLCSINNVVDYIKSSKKYKNLNPYQKENLLVQLFHIRNFSQLKKEHRIVLLQELENVNAKKMKRTKEQFVVLDNSNDTLMDMGNDFVHKKLYIDKKFLLEGVKKAITSKDIQEVKIPYLHIELLDDLFHEQYHSFLNTYIGKNEYKMVENKIYYREYVEFILWFFLKIPEDLSSYYEPSSTSYYIYRTIPEEYYAFKYAKEKVQRIFETLNKMYGKDEHYDTFLQNLINNENEAVFDYQVANNINEDITLDDLYQKMLAETIMEFSKATKNSLETIEYTLKISPSFLDKHI